METWQDAAPVDLSALSELQLNPIVARALLRRGITNPSAAVAFLDARAAQLSSPLDLPGMDAAVARIRLALERGESIWIWGDFDVDGQTATTVLVQALSRLGSPPPFHVPVRAREGHGIQIEALTSVIDAGARLIVTCDTGITAHAAVEYARSRGVDFVITDHHEPGRTLPQATSVVNSRLLPADHPLAHLAGVGVAFELAVALLGERGVEAADLLDLVALGLIADVATLRDDTRRLAQRGIEALRKTSRLGIQTLAQLGGINLASLTEETIGFELAPRLNAVGRLGDANRAVELLLTAEPERAKVLAGEVEELNIRRRLLTEQVAGAAEELLRNEPGLLGRPALILSNSSWPGGVLGIVASRLVERYQKPALLMSVGEDGAWHGSARSVEGLDITAAIAESEEDLIGFGGHPMAAGFSLQAETLTRFERGLQRSAERMLRESNVPAPVLEIDEWLAFGTLSLALADQLAPLAPFGPGNPQLIFATHDVRLLSTREIGKGGKHRRMILRDGRGTDVEMLWWSGADQSIPADAVDVAYSLRATTYGGQRRLTLEVRDMRPSAEAVITVARPGPEIIDLRHETAVESALPAGCLVWVEGSDAARGQNRLRLREAPDLAIWTPPPSRDDLRLGIAAVRPRRVFLIGRPPPSVDFGKFLEQVGGMAKFAIRQRAGSVDPAEMAAATAQRELAVRLALEWLAASGQLSVKEQEAGLELARIAAKPDRDLQLELRRGIQSLLDETAAYRRHFARAEANALLED